MVNEKDVEPDKNRGIGIAFFMLALVFFFLGFFTFPAAFVLQVLSVFLAVIFFGISVYLHFKYR